MITWTTPASPITAAQLNDVIRDNASSLSAIDIDALWDRMYTKAKSVIVVCRYCKSHNAISNPTCVRCGAPLGE